MRLPGTIKQLIQAESKWMCLDLLIVPKTMLNIMDI